ncbi:endothelin-1 [Chanos chanos]|uniref:Endothelin-1 n=1 Tax=Chanos chanos TaxID=29144 RepID=A0A6J2WPN2_CHACN|nr:endothelin-1 [Chanos chanos]
MEIRIIFPMLSMLSSGLFHTVAPASLGEDAVTATLTPARHSRTKRCSCATFLDKECVYFCHLDIIWVNTPERTVSYGLGSAPRKRRSVRGLAYSTQSPRCKCLDNKDNTCADFCQPAPSFRYKAAPDKVILDAQGDDCAGKQCKYNLAAKTERIKRLREENQKTVDPLALRTTKKVRLLLEKWRLGQHHRTRAWEPENATS